MKHNALVLICPAGGVCAGWQDLFHGERTAAGLLRLLRRGVRRRWWLAWRLVSIAREETDRRVVGDASVPKYSRKLPRVAGWYWFAGDRNAPGGRGARPAPVVVRVEIAPRLGPIFRDGRSPFEARKWPGRWAGPLALPK